MGLRKIEDDEEEDADAEDSISEERDFSLIVGEGGGTGGGGSRTLLAGAPRANNDGGGDDDRDDAFDASLSRCSSWPTLESLCVEGLVADDPLSSAAAAKASTHAKAELSTALSRVILIFEVFSFL